MSDRITYLRRWVQHDEPPTTFVLTKNEARQIIQAIDACATSTSSKHPRTRDEVLREFGVAPEFPNRLSVVTMADHIVAVEQQRDEYHRLWKAEVLKRREVEAQRSGVSGTLASGEPVAWLIHLEKPYEPYVSLSHDTAQDAVRYGVTVTPLYAHPAPSAAGVAITDAMVEAAAKALYLRGDLSKWGTWEDEMWRYKETYYEDAKAILEAALTRPTTPTRGSDE